MPPRDARHTRLLLDYTDLMQLASRSEFITVEPVDAQPGWPPDKYLVTFTCRGIKAVDREQRPISSTLHQVEMYLSRHYPVAEPQLRWSTDIWHPNIDHKEPRHVCTNAAESFHSTRPLSDLVISLGEMVQYKRYHAKHEPPYPLDRDVATWVREVAEVRGWLGKDKPFDDRPLLRPLRIVKARRDGATAVDANRTTVTAAPDATHDGPAAAQPVVKPQAGGDVLVGEKPSAERDARLPDQPARKIVLGTATRRVSGGADSPTVKSPSGGGIKLGTPRPKR